MSAQDYSIGNFQDPYNFQEYQGEFNLGYENYGQDSISTGKSLWEKISRFFGGPDNEARYNEWLAKRDREYERQSVQSARAWDEYMQSTQYQRMVKDLEAAGLNPWLALQGSSLQTSHQTTASQGGSAKSKTNQADNAKGLIATLLITVAKLFAA